MNKSKSYHIEIWGCQMNVADAAGAGRQLEALGYVEAPGPETADIVLMQTCCVREKPEHKVYSRLGAIRPFKEARPEMIIGVCGCMAQKEGLEVRRHAPYVDLVIGPRRLHRLPELLDALEATGKPQMDLVMDEEPPEAGVQDYARIRRRGELRAFVNIIEGCNYRCAYCIVPAVRGSFSSRLPAAIVEEVQQLVAAGVREVTLLGQSVLAYGRDRQKAFDVVDLWGQLSAIDELQRIRFTTNHPLEVSERIITAVATMPKVMEHFHMPIQAGDDRLLKAMKRGYTVARYEELLERMRANIPGVSVTGDCIVGFPGETEEMFQQSLETYRRLRLDQQFMFVYSARPGTPAATLPDQLAQEVKVARMIKLVAETNAIGEEINRAQLGQLFEVMVEGPSQRDQSKYTGRARND
ncbi:MAG: tRNA (N6-isopentenyl adenosine(37)-C2)-methylthiotransferase MiaB, partial [bacterium]